MADGACNPGAETFSGERQMLHILLERVADELMTLRRDIGQYEGVVLTQLAGSAHSIGHELQSIDLSLQTLEEVALFVQSLATMTEGDHHLDPARLPMRFRLGDVRDRLLDLHRSDPSEPDPFSIDLF